VLLDLLKRHFDFGSHTKVTFTCLAGRLARKVNIVRPNK